MKFMVAYTVKPQHRSAAVARFLETGGAAPEGVKMLDRWHGSTGNKGWTVAEADDVEAISAWCHRWADLLTFYVEPVMDDEQAARVLSS